MATTTVSAIVVEKTGGPEVLVLSTKDLPALQSDELLVQIKAAGVNPADTYFRAGAFPTTLPYTPGFDGAGIIEAIGSSVTRFAVGDRVYISAPTAHGTYAAKTIAKESQLQRLPDNVDFIAGAAVYVPAGTAYKALFISGKARPGQVVFIHGASGGVGIAAVQLARAAGLTVIGTASTEEGRALVLKEGGHHVFDHKASDYVNQVKQLAEKLGGIDLILEVMANVNLNKDTDIIKPRGRIVVIGDRGSLDFNPRPLIVKNIVLKGFSLPAATEEERRIIFAGLFSALENKTLRPIIAETLPLDQAAKSHHDIIHSTHLGNIILLP